MSINEFDSDNIIVKQNENMNNRKKEVAKDKKFFFNTLGVCICALIVTVAACTVYFVSASGRTRKESPLVPTLHE